MHNDIICSILLFRPALDCLISALHRLYYLSFFKPALAYLVS